MPNLRRTVLKLSVSTQHRKNATQTVKSQYKAKIWWAFLTNNSMIESWSFQLNKRLCHQVINSNGVRLLIVVIHLNHTLKILFSSVQSVKSLTVLPAKFQTTKGWIARCTKQQSVQKSRQGCKQLVMQLCERLKRLRMLKGERQLWLLHRDYSFKNKTTTLLIELW